MFALTIIFSDVKICNLNGIVTILSSAVTDDKEWTHANNTLLFFLFILSNKTRQRRRQMRQEKTNKLWGW